MKKLSLFIVALFISLFVIFSPILAEAETQTSLLQETTQIQLESPTSRDNSDLASVHTLADESLNKLIEGHSLGMVWLAPLQYAIKNAVESGIPSSTIVLLLLLPGVATLIAISRNIIGIRGFGILLPAALSVAFVAIGAVAGIILFLVIVLVATGVRLLLRKAKLRLQYLPRMALLLQFSVLGVLAVLLAAPYFPIQRFLNVSIFPVLILVLLSEDFTRVQIGKSATVAIQLTSETLILALISYVMLTLEPVQNFVILNPEVWMISIFILNFVIGRFIGLRLMEIWRFRKLLQS